MSKNLEDCLSHIRTCDENIENYIFWQRHYRRIGNMEAYRSYCKLEENERKVKRLDLKTLAEIPWVSREINIFWSVYRKRRKIDHRRRMYCVYRLYKAIPRKLVSILLDCDESHLGVLVGEAFAENCMKTQCWAKPYLLSRSLTYQKSETPVKEVGKK